MTDPLLEQDDASTPLTPDERADLILSYISQRRELNEAEQANIVEAELWALARTRDVLSERFLRQLHRRMFGNVWKWAGKIRQSEKNIGVEVWKINTELAQLLSDTRYWIENGTYALDEIAARFHHRLVWIHPFANGNGRHSRFATDLLLIANGVERFTWGSVNLVDASTTRRAYVDALRAADHHDLDLLFAFVRS
jgi:Fic-DOC domain mobile mystery protein B